MGFREINFILIFSTIIFFSASFIKAADITSILNNHNEFSIFNGLLTQTGVAAAINSRHTITVLVVDNAAMGSIISRPEAQAINILMAHVILDYYDDQKLATLNDKTVLLTTLFQTTGLAVDQQGFLNVTVTGDGHDVVFGSAVRGAPRGSRMIQNVVADPYEISVIQISEPIIVPGMDQVPTSPSSTPKPSPSPSGILGQISYGPTHSPSWTPTGPITAPQEEDKSPSHYEGLAPGPAWDWDWDHNMGSALGPAPQHEDNHKAPALAPKHEAATSAPGPEVSEVPASSPETNKDEWDVFAPVPAPAPAPSSDRADDEDENEAPPPRKNGAARVSSGGGAVVVASLMGLIMALLL